MMTTQWISQQMPDLSSITQCPRSGQRWVFSAIHAQNGNVMIKVFTPGTNTERVNREVLTINKVNPPRVPKILDVGTFEESPWGNNLIWLREQRIMGEDIRQILNNGTLLGKDDVLCLALNILETLAEVEQERIVHRDIKPDNIVRSEDHSFWLLDFGIARHLDLTSITDTFAIGGPGTVGYAPPEQLKNRKHDIDSRTDLFALAVTLVECITGKNPYIDGARDSPHVIRKIETSSLLIPIIPWDINMLFTDLISTMGQRRIDLRPSTAKEAFDWMKDIYNTLKV